MVNAIKRPQQLSIIKRRYNISIITYAIMIELDCPICHQRYTIPEESCRASTSIRQGLHGLDISS